MYSKPKFCSACPISDFTEGYVPLKLRPGTSLVVGEAAGEDEVKSGEGFSGGSGTWLKNMFRVAKQPWESISTINCIGCRPPENVFPGDNKWRWTDKGTAQAAVNYCRKQHLMPALQEALAKGHAQKIYAVGAKALEALTGKYGIYTWRGSVLPLTGGKTPQVIPTIHPAALMRQSKFTSVVIRDLRRGLTVAPEHYNLFPTLADVQRFKSKRFAFDFEWDKDGNITVCGLSDRFYGAIVVPWWEPYITELRRIFESAEELIGHNIVGADLPFIERLGWNIGHVKVQDTMLKQHLVQPDYPHDLAFVASVFTNKVFWKGKWEEVEEEGEGEYKGQQWRTWDRPDAIPRKIGGYGGCVTAQEAFALYNARDTDAEFQINTPLDQMLEKWELEPVYRHVSLPAGYICRWMSERGLRLDTTRLGEIRTEVDTAIADLEEKLPYGLRPYTETVSCNLPAPEGTYRAKSKTCKGTRRVIHAPVTVVFTQLDEKIACEACGKILTAGKMELAKIVKGTREETVHPYNSPQLVQRYVESLSLRTVLDHKTGNATTGKKARQIWAKDHPEFVTLGALKQNITIRNNFAKDALLTLDRMFFNLKVHGTAEGRLSSSGKRRGIDLNIQNQPDKDSQSGFEFRVIYVPEREDWGFVNLDISQGESWLTCWLAKDWARWEKLQDGNYDEHSELAQAIFGCPVNKKLAKLDKAINALRQLGKKINHGRAYGMGIKKQLEELQSQGYEQFKEADVRDFIETWKKLNAGTALWQQQTMEMAARQGYLRNPFGRVRWFSHRDGTQALAFLPASSLADMVLRMMICHYPEQFFDSIQANQTAVFHPLVEEWIMSIQVHDSLVLQGPWATKDEQIARSTSIMTQPFPQLDNFAFRVDCKASQKSWGECN